MSDDAIVEEEATPSPVFSDSDLAERFAERHRGLLRFVAPWDKWMRYDAGRWHQEDTLLAFDLIRKLCRELSAECNRTTEAKALASAKTIAAVERIAKADRRLAATIDQWDSDPWLSSASCAANSSYEGYRGSLVNAGLFRSPEAHDRPAGGQAGRQPL